jgi:O-antigen/teichoic acid export membrane protein
MPNHSSQAAFTAERMLRRFQTRLLGRFAILAGAIVLSALVSLIMLPFSTMVLHAGDFGTYAMLMSIVALVGTAIDGGASILLPAHYELASGPERGRIFSSLAVFAVLCASAAGLLLIGFWLWHHSVFAEQPGHLIIAMTAILMPLRVLTTISNMSFSVTGRSSAIALQIVCQAAAVFGGTLIALFGFSMGGEALFIGAGFGQLAALLVCLATLQRHGELGLPSGYWLRQALISQPTTATAGFMDGARNFGESLMLSSAAGLAAVGILSHAKLYFNLLHMFASAVAQNTWAKSLQDALDPRSTFDATRKAWAPVQVAIGCAAIVFVFLGRDIVGFISNGKLTEAADYVPVFFMMALIQNSEQPALAVVFALGRGASAAWFRSLLVTVTLILLYPAIVLFGIKGLLVAAVIESCALRLFLRRLASRDRHVPFQDQIGAFGCLVIAVAMIYQHVAVPALLAQIIAVAVGIAVIAVFGSRSVGQTFIAARELLVPKPTPRQVG